MMVSRGNYPQKALSIFLQIIYVFVCIYHTIFPSYTYYIIIHQSPTEML